jgi:hypothetical protein
MEATIDFLEPHGSESQGYIHYSGIYLFLARKPSCCKKWSGSTRETNTPLIVGSLRVPCLFRLSPLWEGVQLYEF